MSEEPPVIEITGLGKTYRVTPTASSGVAGLAERLRRRAARAGSLRPDAEVVDDLEDDIEDDREPEDAEEPVAHAREVVALRDVNLRIGRGRAVGITGPVGSGKSTLLRIIGRVSPPSAGRVVVRGRVAPLLDLSSGFLTQSATGRQNAYLIARLFGVPRQIVDRQIDDIFAFAGLEARIDHRAGRYSAGEYKRLGYAIALHLETDVLLADERLVRGDDDFERRCRDRLLALREAGQTLLFVSRDVKSLRATCDELIVLEQGRVVSHERTEDAPVEAAPAAAPEPEPDNLLEPRRLLELRLRGIPHEELARMMDVNEDAVPRRIHEAVLHLVPRGGAVGPRVRRDILEYLLGAPGVEQIHALRRALGANADAHAWAAEVREVLIGLCGDQGPTIRELPEFDEVLEPDGPRPKLAAVELLDDIGRQADSEHVRRVLVAAQRAAAHRGADAVTLRDVAEAADMPLQEAKRRVGGLRAGAVAGAKVTDERWDAVSGKVVARLLGPDGVTATVLRRSDAATIELLLSTLTPEIGVLCRLGVATQAGFRTRFEQPEEWAAPEPGWWRVTVDLPPDSLPDGTLMIRVSVRLRHDYTKVTIDHPGLLEFEVVGDEPDAPLDDDQRPEVKWSVTSAPA